MAAIAVVTALTALTALAVPLTAAAAFAAETPASGPDLVLPAPTNRDAGASTVQAATSTGVVLGRPDVRKFVPFEGEARLFDAQGATKVYNTGTDTIALWNETTSTMLLRTGPDGADESYALGKTLKPLGVVGRTVIATEPVDGGSRAAVHLIALQAGGVVDRTVATVDAKAPQLLGSNARGGLLRYTAGTHAERKEMWIDVAGGGNVVHVGAEALALDNVRVTGDWIIRGDWYNKAAWKVYDTRADVNAAVRSFPYVAGVDYAYAYVGDELVVGNGIGTVHALPLNGGPLRKLFALEMDATVEVTASGNRFFTVSTSSGDSTFDVIELKADEEGRIQPVKVGVVPAVRGPLDYVALENGRAHVSRRDPIGQSTARHFLSHTDPVVEARGADRAIRNHWSSYQTTGEVVPTADGSLLHFRKEDGSLWQSRMLRASGLEVNTLQAGSRYAAARVAGNPGLVRAFHTGTWTFKDFAVPGGAFALSGKALWRNTATAGTVEALDARTGSKLATVKVADCAVKEMQALTSSLYWKCDGGRAGVYDTVSKTTAQLPAFNGTARLGQGFVAFTDGASLKVADVKGTTGVREIAKPRTTQVGIGWTVDRYTNRIAYLDADLDVRVTPLVTPTPALSTYDTDVPAGADMSPGGSWAPTWWLSKPGASWSVSLTSKATGKWVHGLWGGEVRGSVRPKWDGKDSTGRNVPNGSYTWTLKVKPADGQGPELVRTGTVNVTGKAVHRDFTGEKTGDLFTTDAQGRLSLRPGNGAGGVGAQIPSAEAWPTTSKFVPVGDMNDDRVNDVLVRDAAGVLRAYHSAPLKPVTPSTPSKYIGPGWGQYDVLTSPGDLTGDGRADLIARQATTGDIYFYAQDGTGVFKPRVRIMLNWKLYKHVFGAGDLNGDGVGDLLAVDGNGTMWRYDGIKGGTLKPRVQVGAAASAAGRSDFVGVGDISGDGKADILSRSAAGELVRNLGLGNGTFAGSRIVTGGFGAYKNLL
ncbi:FG-GAP repeat domain-containing protein [Streptomyces sp. NPDC012888]|uniref:FG-GAP repeat domain-containing protein n=1 Tax=Streptomyces sp. NPDC012888 TaxID=3364855 RepID=UPI0036AC7F15